MVAESAYGQAALKDALATQSAAATMPGGDPQLGWAQRALDGVSNVLTKHHIGWHPERTAQLLDQQWLALLKRVDAGLPAALDVPRPGAADDGASPLRWWRSPLGRAMVEVPAVTFQPYLRRRLDLELHREAAALALNAQRLAIAPAARAAWAQQQPASPALRERMTWTADGRTLSVRSWAAETQPISRPADQPPAARDRIHITLDRAAAP